VPPRRQTALDGFVTFDVTDRLSEIRVPTLVVCGRRDGLIPVCQRGLLARIPGAERVVLEESEHDLDEIKRFRETVRRLIARILHRV
jgi:pimeloyl-ACP methyl ester carboxylesterase